MTLALATAPHPRGRQIDDREKALLRALFAADPAAPCSAIRERFVAATGHALSLRMVQIYRPGPVAPAPPRTRDFTPAQRDVLLGLIRADPAASNRAIAARFLAVAGRPVGPSSIKACRRRHGLARPAPPPASPAARDSSAPGPDPIPADHFPGLPRDQAGALSWIVANRPDLSPIACVALLAAEISHQSDHHEATAS